ncbi:MAG: glycosyl transferase [Mycobacterium sp.]|nr:glycosyl transferase [Mycobacterium sp.]
MRNEFERTVVVIPAHNESARLPDCLKAVVTAVAACSSMTVLTVVVLDACDDASADLAGRFGSDVHFIQVDARNVGASRAAGFTYARSSAGMDSTDESRTWYATTDADSRVDPGWLIRQTASGADMVLGVVRIANWRHLPGAAVRRVPGGIPIEASPGRTRSRPRCQHGVPGRSLLARGWIRRTANR